MDMNPKSYVQLCTNFVSLQNAIHTMFQAVVKAKLCYAELSRYSYATLADCNRIESGVAWITVSRLFQHSTAS